MIYFDNAATSFYKPKEVRDCVLNSINHFTANPGRSGHFLSNQTAEKVFEAREILKQFFHAENYDVVFTKNCTEALNLALFGVLKNGDHVITTCYEHNSVLRPLERLKNCGVEVTILDCELSQVHKHIEEKIKPNTKLVVVTMASNVLGAESNVSEIAKICNKHKIFLLLDGAQACGHVDIDLENLGADMMAFAGHKGLLSLAGVGGLIVKDLRILNPLLLGGTGTNSESLKQNAEVVEDFESGTLPVSSILSLGASVKFLIKNFEKIKEYEENLIKYAYFKLKKLKFLKIYSNDKSKNIICFNVENSDSVEVANFLNDKFGICVRAGLHCAPLVHKKLGTLESGAVRVSLDFNNTIKEIDRLVFALNRFYELNFNSDFAKNAKE